MRRPPWFFSVARADALNELPSFLLFLLFMIGSDFEFLRPHMAICQWQVVTLSQNCSLFVASNSIDSTRLFLGGGDEVNAVVMFGESDESMIRFLLFQFQSCRPQNVARNLTARCKSVMADGQLISRPSPAGCIINCTSVNVVCRSWSDTCTLLLA